ncbi:COG4223 family protein [Jannaschia pohangensis]|uniref:Inner membrane protein n=1 Tax=Jannaschia pohangensis TaxID=390807 RepID=A0A1I3PZ48_9RHOB|nr:hypothetical protein [Jannaschia pohangensis]SFJ26695.1 hypothetical protein SAMN04488095_2354 [Jannaschia pohangensis]
MARSKKNTGSTPDKDQTVETSTGDAIEDAMASDTPPAGDDADESFDETLDDVLNDPEGEPVGTAADESGLDRDDAPADEDAAATEPDAEDAEATTDLVTVEGAERQDHDVPDADVEEDAAKDEEPATVLPATAPQVIEKRGPGFVPLVLGGLVAGAIGYAIPTFVMPPADESTARLDALEAQLAALPAAEEPDLSALVATQDTLRADVDALAERIAALETAEPASGAAPAAGASTASDAGLRGDVTALSDRTDAVETAVSDLTGRVDALESGFTEATGAAESVVAEAEALARQAAQNQIALALQSGVPFADQVEILGDVPPDLAAVADAGVVTQATLVAEFPPLAREALRLSRSGQSGGGVGSLFRNAFNPRSLEPREGDDVDAVLSRVEAAVRGGDLAAALNEMDALPPEAAAPLADWRARVETRAAALAAADAYLQDG